VWKRVLYQRLIDAMKPVVLRSRVVCPFPIRRGSHGREHQHERHDGLPLVVLGHEAVGGFVSLFDSQRWGFGLVW